METIPNLKTVMNSNFGMRGYKPSDGLKALEAKLLKSTEEIEKKRRSESEWIWIDGYKGTDKDMRCRDVQFELGKTFVIENGKEIKECENGYHLCRNLKDVFQYYDLSAGNRYFKVRALVRISDIEEQDAILCSPSMSWANAWSRNRISTDKLASKAIEFISEISDEELRGAVRKFYRFDDNMDDKYLDMAIKEGATKARETYEYDMLIDDGYSETFAKYISKHGNFDRAHALASVEGLSMDVKVLSIFLDD